jgi:protein-disulfide isomerase
MRRYLPFVIVGAVLLIAAGWTTSLFFWKERLANKNSLDNSSGVEAAVLSRGAIPAHIRGSPNAKVKVEEFGDFQCPSCAALSPALNQAEQKYQGKVCLTFRQYPIASHPHGQEAAQVAEAAGLQDRFWEMHDLLYGSQLLWTRRADTGEIFEQFAKSIGLDLERFKTELESEQVKARIIADQQRAASLDVNRTPAIFINGERLPDSSLNQNALQEAIVKAVNAKAR